MTRAEKLYEKYKDNPNVDVFELMSQRCPYDHMDGPDFKGKACRQIGGDCFLCWMAEYKEE